MFQLLRVISLSGIATINAEVTRLIRQGWVLQGSPFQLGKLPAQVVVYPDDPETDDTYEYRMVSGANAILELEAKGWNVYGDPFEAQGLHTQAMVLGDVPSIGAGTGSGGAVEVPSLKTKRVAGTTYTLLQEDENTQLIFDSLTDVTLTLPAGVTGTDTKAFAALALNKSGVLKIAGTYVAYADQADKGVTIGIIKNASEYIVTGTNVSGELG